MSRSTIKAAFDNIGAQELPLSITPGMIADALNALLNEALLSSEMDETPIQGSTNPVKSGGVKAALAAKADKNELGDSESGTFAQIENNTLRLSAYEKIVLGISDPDDEFIEISNDNIQNLRRALTNPDSTPIVNSTNLVTSGGVKAALDNKAPAGDTEVIFEEGENIFVYLPNYFTNGERQRSFILNYQGDAEELIELFGGGTNDTIRILSHDDSTLTVGECYIAVRVIKQPGGATQGDAYFIIFDGRNDY